MELLKSPEFPFTNSSAGINGVEDDYTEIEFLKDYVETRGRNQLWIYNFEKSGECEKLRKLEGGYDRGFCKVTYHKVTSDGNLDGRVSSVRIAFPHREGEK